MFTWRKCNEGVRVGTWEDVVHVLSHQSLLATKLSCVFFLLFSSQTVCKPAELRWYWTFLSGWWLRLVWLQESSITVTFEGTNPSHLFPPFGFSDTWALHKYREPMNSSTTCPSKSGIIADLLFLFHSCHPVCIPSLVYFSWKGKRGKDGGNTQQS